jgi:hypothetical protein
VLCGVFVLVAVAVKLPVGVDVAVTNAVGVLVGVIVKVTVPVGVAVRVCVEVAVGIGVTDGADGVGVAVGPLTTISAPTHVIGTSMTGLQVPTSLRSLSVTEAEKSVSKVVPGEIASNETTPSGPSTNVFGPSAEPQPPEKAVPVPFIDV